jgi:RNA polymerase sigma-70 factor (ECF subfamily)
VAARETAPWDGIVADAAPEEVPGAVPAGGTALDAVALDGFVRTHHERLLRLARLVCRDRSEAADAVQVALEQAWRRRDSLRDGGALQAWLDRIVVREAIRIDRRRRSPLGRLLGGATVDQIEVIDERSAPDPTLIALRTAFEGLPADQRIAIALHLHLGYSVAETAELVGAPAETVRSRLRVGRERLRAILGDRVR